MTDEELLEFLKLTLYTSAVPKTGPNVGKTPSSLTEVKPEDLNEIDLVHESRLRVKCFYTSAQKSNNQTAFYIEISESEYDVWSKASLLFYKSKQTGFHSTSLEALRAKIGSRTPKEITTPVKEDKSGW